MIPVPGRACFRTAMLGRRSVLAIALCAGCGDSDEPKPAWEGRTYLLDIPSTSWSEPAGVGRDIGEFVPQFLITLERASGDTYDALLGTAEAGVQNTCNPTTRVEAVARPYPNVEIVAREFPMYLRHVREDVVVTATIRDLSLRNILPDGAALAEEGQLTALVDARELYPLFTLIPQPSAAAVCAALAAFDAPCGPCATDDEPFCLALEAVRLGAIELEIPVAPVAADTLDPACLD